MNAFARISSTLVSFARRVAAPALLAATVVTGSLGFSNVASAQERIEGRPAAGVVAGPRGVGRGPVVGAPFHRRFAPALRGGRRWGAPGYAWGRPGWRAPARGGFHGGFHGGIHGAPGRGLGRGGRGGGFHGGGHR